MSSNLIFDFDGTICDSYEVFEESFRVVCKKYNLDASVFDDENVRDLSSDEILKKLKVTWWKLPFILRSGRSEMYKRRERLKIFSEVEKVLPELSQNFDLFIVTSNSNEIVHEVLKENVKYFKEIYGGHGLTNKSKRIKKICNKNPREKSYYIGDEVRDIKCAHKSKVEAVAVTWGYNTVKRLNTLKNVIIINSPTDLLIKDK